MANQLNPYISFNGTARQAMMFYQAVFGGKLDFHTFDEYGAAEDPADASRIMHSTLHTPGGIAILAADTPTQMGEPPASSNISLSLSDDDESQLRSYWEKLTDGGTVVVALAPQLWGDVFGMCVDKFGVAWMINIGSDSDEGFAV